jgi:hypothetical protein
VKRSVFAVLVVLASVSLSACASPGSGYSVPAPVSPPGPSAHTVEVTAVHAGKPVSDLDVSLTENSWPAKDIAKGKTNSGGKVKLSAKWSNQDVICAGAQLDLGSGQIQRVFCTNSFPNSITFVF